MLSLRKVAALTGEWQRRVRAKAAWRRLCSGHQWIERSVQHVIPLCAGYFQSRLQGHWHSFPGTCTICCTLSRAAVQILAGVHASDVKNLTEQQSMSGHFSICARRCRGKMFVHALQLCDVGWCRQFSSTRAGSARLQRARVLLPGLPRFP